MGRGAMWFSGVLFVVIGIAALIGGIAMGGPGSSGLIIVGVVFLPCAALFFWIGNWGIMGKGKLDSRPELEEFGRPAYAEVLQVEPGVGDAGSRARLKVNVTPANEGEYKTQVDVPSSMSVPTVGQTVSVKFDPNKRKRAILVGEAQTASVSPAASWGTSPAASVAPMPLKTGPIGPAAVGGSPLAPTMTGSAAPEGGDSVGRLEKLAELRRSGALTDSEFEAEKAKILSSSA
jgi:Short C-terminal domain